VKIEAVYAFPLPAHAAVDRMVMLVGDGRVVGEVKEREEAHRIYEAARAAGHVAGLLDQERPNIFTQSVANIEPGARVVIEISYVETLAFEDGFFEWVFPMVVGPRYVPGGGPAPTPVPVGRQPVPVSVPVPDADRITPTVTPEGTRAGHDISLTVDLDPGMEIHDLESVLHEIDVDLFGRTGTRVTLTNKQTIPNRDFVLRYRLSTDAIGHAFRTHRDPRGDFFTLVLQPPRRVEADRTVARELVFVVDTSGSMRGFPLDKAKEVVSRLVDSMREDDTFNLITFAGTTRVLWDEPRPSTAERRAEAQAFLESHTGGGGTEMMRAIRTALRQTDRDSTRKRIVCFLTDGYVGNDMELIDEVKRNADTTRVFSFGIGNSVNRYLLDGMAHAGRGEVEYVTLQSQADAAVRRFHERVRSPVLTDIAIDWSTLPVAEVFPRRIPDLFAAKPILVHGRLTGAPVGTITLVGETAAGPFQKSIRLISPKVHESHDALASLWARAKVTDLMNRDLRALQHGEFPDELKREIVSLGVEFQLATQFTSFVAVEETVVTVGGEPRTIRVPVEMPAAVSYEGVFGKKDKRGASVRAFALRPGPKSAPPVQWQAAEALASDVDLVDERRRTPGTIHSRAKLAEALRGLAERVAEQGRAGNLAIGGVVVADYKVEVIVRPTDASATTLAALEALGLERLEVVESSVSRLAAFLVGRIDVRKLDELAAAEQVVSVEPLLAR
jgi:Ca-activated chloride channel family protein